MGGEEKKKDTGKSPPPMTDYLQIDARVYLMNKDSKNFLHFFLAYLRKREQKLEEKRL